MNVMKLKSVLESIFFQNSFHGNAFPFSEEYDDDDSKSKIFIALLIVH